MECLGRFVSGRDGEKVRAPSSPRENTGNPRGIAYRLRARVFREAEESFRLHLFSLGWRTAYSSRALQCGRRRFSRQVARTHFFLRFLSAALIAPTTAPACPAIRPPATALPRHWLLCLLGRWTQGAPLQQRLAPRGIVSWLTGARPLRKSHPHPCTSSLYACAVRGQ